jgi:hypothetical protein
MVCIECYLAPLVGLVLVILKEYWGHFSKLPVVRKVRITFPLHLSSPDAHLHVKPTLQNYIIRSTTIFLETIVTRPSKWLKSL